MLPSPALPLPLQPLACWPVPLSRPGQDALPLVSEAQQLVVKVVAHSLIRSPGFWGSPSLGAQAADLTHEGEAQGVMPHT